MKKVGNVPELSYGTIFFLSGKQYNIYNENKIEKDIKREDLNKSE